MSDDPPLHKALKIQAHKYEVYSSYAALGKLALIRLASKRWADACKRLLLRLTSAATDVSGLALPSTTCVTATRRKWWRCGTFAFAVVASPCQRLWSQHRWRDDSCNPHRRHLNMAVEQASSAPGAHSPT
jgi:hypothetical protein